MSRPIEEVTREALDKSFPCLGAKARPATADLEVSPGLRPIGAHALSESETAGNDRREICKRPFTFTHQCKLATEKRLYEWSSHFWGNSCEKKVLTN